MAPRILLGMKIGMDFGFDFNDFIEEGSKKPTCEFRPGDEGDIDEDDDFSIGSRYEKAPAGWSFPTAPKKTIQDLFEEARQSKCVNWAELFEPISIIKD